MPQPTPLLADLSPPEDRRARRLALAAPICSGLLIVITLIALACWSQESPAFEASMPALFVMKANTAIGLLLAAIALAAISRHSTLSRIITWIASLTAIILATLTLAEYSSHRNLGIDQLLFTDHAHVLFPGRTSPGSALCLLCISVATLLLDLRRIPVTAQVLFFLAAAPPLSTLGGYLYRAPGLDPSTPLPVIAFHTAVCQILLCLAGLFARNHVGLMRLVISESFAGSTARRLLPLALFLPLLVGALIILGEQTHLWSVEFGSALLVCCCALLFAAAVWLTTSLLWKIEKNRVAEERRFQAEREQLLSAEQAARSQAERASAMKDEFLATLSHELRTPLNAILGWSNILQRSADTEDLQEGLAVIERNARVQSHIVEDLLDMSRIISGNIRLDVQSIELPSLVDQAIESVRPTAEAKGVRLLSTIDRNAGGQINGDPARLQQIIWNLLSNALKFTPKGGRIRVLLERDRSAFQLTIADTGQGIAPDFLPFLFDRFRQADASITRRHGGLGLGLAIVKQLVELHGGSVHAASEGPNSGATFTVHLPIAILHARPGPSRGFADDASPAAEHTPIPLDLNLAGLRILVVDDEPDACALIKKLLENRNALVRVAQSAPSALHLLESETFDVLVSDIGMPGEDGYTLIRRVRRLASPSARVPAVALTAYARPEDRIRAITAGFQSHLAKPVEPAELLTMVAAAARHLRG